MTLIWWVRRLWCARRRHQLWYMPDGRVHCFHCGIRVG